jgi:Zn finger protein HypA/HybF involved in hydrogenase expression
MSKLVRLLKSPKEKASLRSEELQLKCSKCGKRTATNQDGMCDSCRFSDILTGLNPRK